MAEKKADVEQPAVEQPAVKSAHEVHMERAARCAQHAKPKPQRGRQPGTHAQKHPKDEAGKFRHK